MRSKYFIVFTIVAIFNAYARLLIAQMVALVPQFGHFQSITSLIFSPDSSYLASAADDGEIKIWDPTTGVIINTFSSYSRPILSLAFHPDGKLLYSGDKNGVLYIWEISSANLIRSIQGPVEGLYSLACNPDGRYLCSGSGYGMVQLWNLETMAPEAVLQGIVRLVSNVAFSPDGKKLAFTIGDFDLKIWDLVNMVDIFTFSGHRDEIYDLAYSHTGNYIATGGKDGRLILWDMTKGVTQQMWEIGPPINAVQFADHDQAIVIATSDNKIQLLQLGQLDPQKQILTSREIKALALRGTTIFYGDTEGMIQAQNIDNPTAALKFGTNLKPSLWCSQLHQGNTFAFNQGPFIAFYDRTSGKLTQSLQITSDELQALTISHNGEYIAYLDRLSIVHIFDLKQNRERQLGSADLKLTCLSFHPLQPQIAVGAKNGMIKIWDLNTDQIVFEISAHDRPVSDLLFDSRGDYLVSAGRDKKIRVTNLATAEDDREFVHDAFNFTSICFINNGLSLLAGTEQGILIELDFNSLRLKFQDSPHQRKIHLLHSLDNKLLVGSMDQTLTLWDWNRRLLEKRIEPGTAGTNYARLLDTKTLCTSGDDGLIKFYDLSTGRLKATFALIDKDTFVAWSPENQFTGNQAGFRFLMAKTDNKLMPAVHLAPNLLVNRLDDLLK